jgi:hypothetical protein
LLLIKTALVVSSIGEFKFCSLIKLLNFPPVSEGSLNSTLNSSLEILSSSQIEIQKSKLTNVAFKGLLSPNELKRISAQCFVGYNLLNAQSLSYYYSLSNKYFDYVQAGIPSISSHLPEYELLNSEYGCGVCIKITKVALI